MGLQMSNQILKYSCTEAANVCTIRLLFWYTDCKGEGAQGVTKEKSQFCIFLPFSWFLINTLFALWTSGKKFPIIVGWDGWIRLSLKSLKSSS